MFHFFPDKERCLVAPIIILTNPEVMIMCFHQSNAVMGEASFTVLVVWDAITQLCGVQWHWLNFNDRWR